MGLIGALKQRILIGDGAMGTLLYSDGIDRCFEELNLTHPERVESVHRAYIDAGADVIQTNTYGANSIKLARYGLEDKVEEINRKAVQIAKAARGVGTFVLGTIGGIHGSQHRLNTEETIEESFTEQLEYLLDEGVDGLILETYYDLDELKSVLKIARAKTDLPILTNVTMHEPGILENGVKLGDALKQLEDAGADIVGVNCRLGPYHMLEALEEVPLQDKAFLAAYPNASLPELKDGKLVYVNEPDYFVKCGQEFRDEGVRLIGGCCGTTPEHIKALANGVRNIKPLQEKEVTETKEPTIARSATPASDLPPLPEIAKKRPSVIVEWDPPKHLDITEYMQGVHAFNEAGVDAITLADNSLATPRISNTAIATKIEQEVGVRTLVHVTCRDRNMIGLQSHLLGLHTLGMNEILAITGDPTKIGDFPGATSVFDVISFDLIKLMKQSNEGVSFSGNSLLEKTNFSVAAAFNPNVANMKRAVQRMERKIEAGADYFLTQPVYNPEVVREMAKEMKHLDTPVYVGLMPLTSSRNAEFLHNEVPGIKLTDEVRERMYNARGSRVEGIEESIKISKELIDVILENFNGVYLVTPFMRYDMIVRLVEYIHEKTGIEIQPGVPKIQQQGQ